MLGLHSFVGFFSSFGERDYSICGLGAAPVAGQELQGPQALAVVARTGLVIPCHVGSSQFRDRTRIPASAGGFFTTRSPGKPLSCMFQLWLDRLLTTWKTKEARRGNAQSKGQEGSETKKKLKRVVHLDAEWLTCLLARICYDCNKLRLACAKNGALTRALEKYCRPLPFQGFQNIVNVSAPTSCRNNYTVAKEGN